MIGSTRANVRWIAVPIATVLAMVLSAILLSLIVEPLERIAAVRQAAAFVAGLQGGIVAFVTLATARAVAPSHRRLIVLVVLLFGSWAAGRVLGDWVFPEYHPRAYKESHLPLVITLVSGIASMLMLWHRKDSRGEASPGDNREQPGG
jgi:hypothetical protein